MHHDATGKVAHADFTQNAAIGQDAAAPDPMYHRRIAQQHPKAREDQHEAKAHAFHIGADDQGRGDDGKGHLEGKEQHLGQGARQAVGIDAVQKRLAQPAPQA